MNELVYLKADEARTDSLQVAEYFHKNHQHVLEKIDKIVVENSTTKSMFNFPHTRRMITRCIGYVI